MTHDADREEAYAHGGTGRLSGPRVWTYRRLLSMRYPMAKTPLKPSWC